ncbi:unnamed protein product, partial [Ectocarpus sp. 13 AM-2016]
GGSEELTADDGVVSGRRLHSGKGYPPPSESGRKTCHRLLINRGLRAMAGVKRAELENQRRDIRLTGSVLVRPRSRSGEPPDEPIVWLWNWSGRRGVSFSVGLVNDEREKKVPDWLGLVKRSF